MLRKSFLEKTVLVVALVFWGMFCTYGYANAGTFSARGEVFDSDGVTPLPGTGLSDLGTADPTQPYGYVQCIYAGPDGEIDPPDTDGSTTDDDLLLETAEYPGQFFTAIGEGFPFFPDGRFYEDFTHSLNVGNAIYSRVWNGTSPSTSTHYGDSGLYSLADNEFDENDFGTWSTDIPTSAGLPEIDVDPISLNYDDVFIGSSSSLSVTIMNTGTADLDVSSIALGAGTSADFAITSGPSLPVSVVPGANVTVQVTYSPIDEDADSGTLVIESNDTDEAVVTVSLSGNGVAVPVPEIDVSPMSLDYGDVFIGSSSSLLVTIANIGSADLDVTSIALGAATSADFAIAPGPSSIVVAPGANTTVAVTYSPSDVDADSGTLVIESNDADEPVVTVSLSGNGVPEPVPEIDVSPMSLDYGDVFIGSSSSLLVTIANIGSADLDVTSIGLGAGSSLDFEVTSGPSLPVSVVPGANVSVQVTYSPIDEDADSGTLVIESNDTDEAVVTVSLSGNGVPEPVPEIDVSPMSLDYGDVFIGSDLAIAVTIKNIGTADLDVTSIALGAATSADFAIAPGPSSITLVPGANVTVQVTYSASDEGTDSGTLEIESDDADEPVVIVSLSGNGVPVPVPEIDVSPMSINYGDVYAGSTSTDTVTISNTGTADLEVAAISLAGSTDFSITSGPVLPATIVPGASVEVDIAYGPTDLGADTATVNIFSNDSDEPEVIVSLSGNGVPVPVPEIEVSPMSLEYGDVFIGSSSSLSVTITNIGTADLDVTDIALGVGTSADFAITSGPASIVLAPGANTTVDVTYSPTDEGADSGTVVIESDDPDEPTVTVSLFGTGVLGPSVLEVDIDIKPGSSTNPINLKSKGKVPVAILSRPTFDATSMDRDSVLFAGAPALDIGRSPKDVDGDGLPDIVLHFEVQDLDIDPEDTELCLTGSTISGQEVKGCDTVKIISK